MFKISAYLFIRYTDGYMYCHEMGICIVMVDPNHVFIFNKLEKDPSDVVTDRQVDKNLRMDRCDVTFLIVQHL